MSANQRVGAGPSHGVLCRSESVSGAAQELGDDLTGLLTALVGDAL
jgi:hypothetical protein